jgi:hypothetical protein
VTAHTIFSQSTNWTLTNDGNAYTLGMQFSVSQPESLTGIWFHSATGATVLPVQCVVFNGDTTAQVSGTLNTSPSWSGAAGSGWVKCSYDGSVILSPGIHYVVSVLYNATGSNWYSEQNLYWTSGAGGSGLSSGPLSAPNSASALNGQALYHAGTTLTFPTTTTTGFDFAVDVEVSDISSPMPLMQAPLCYQQQIR